MGAKSIGDARSEAELGEAIALRVEVFVHEQGVDEAAEVDGLDAAACHLLARLGGHPVGTLRIRMVDDGALAKIERVAVRKAARGTGLGRELVLAAIDRARQAGARRALLHAQVAVQGFYGRLGFEASGEPFIEDGILHVRMTLDL